MKTLTWDEDGTGFVSRVKPMIKYSIIQHNGMYLPIHIEGRAFIRITPISSTSLTEKEAKEICERHYKTIL